MLKKNIVVKTTFDEYKVIEQCGQGGNSTVFKVSNNNGDIVALKIMNRNNSKIKTNRFQNEINFCYKNDHENIVKIIDFGSCLNNKGEECIFCIMPYYPQTLRDKIDSNFSSDDYMQIFYEILNGLKFSHDKEAFHRDLKPENILFDDKSNTAVISDFGIAHFRAEDLIANVNTKLVDKLANANYAAPEQRIKGAIVDGRCDIFAISLILNEMFTKKVVIGGNYKKIGEIDSDYDYLDVLFDELNSQESKDRLYPIDKILLELSILTRNKANETQLKNLNQYNIKQNSKNDSYMTPKVIDIKYENMTLILIIEPAVPREWIYIFSSCNYGHSSVMGFEPNKFSNGVTDNKQKFSIKCSEQSVIDIVKYFKQWLPIVTSKFNNELRLEKERENRKNELSRINEIEKLEVENRVNSMLRDLL